MEKLFTEEYMEPGSKGPAVALLQIILLARGHNHEKIVPDGVYGPETEKGVRLLQATLGFPAAGQDGSFGPATRRALLEKRRIDIDALSANLFAGPGTYVRPAQIVD